MKGQAAVLLASSFRPPLATIFSVPSGNGRWSFSASSAGAGIHCVIPASVGRITGMSLSKVAAARLVLLRSGQTAGRRSSSKSTDTYQYGGRRLEYTVGHSNRGIRIR